MKYAFNAVLHDRHGQPITEQDKSAADGLRPVTSGDVACAVLDAAMPGDTFKDKARNWDLIKSITAAEKAHVALEVLDSDIEAIKQRVGQIHSYPATLVGAFLEVLKPEADSPVD